MSSTGAVTITGATSIELNAPTISLNGAVVEVKATTAAVLNGGAACTVKAALVSIN
jgi:predicted secreted protein